MPRITRRLVRQALSVSPRLPPLLRASHSLQQARSELRWIEKELPRSEWVLAINRRARREPLQYILGTQPFGDLEIQCRPGVLIPRWETEEWTLSLAAVLANHCPSVRILDGCTGSGCIPLLLKHELPSATVEAFDVSPAAYDLACSNKERCADVSFHLADVLRPDMYLWHHPFDLVTANPPYVPEGDYHRPVLLNGLEMSVKQYEPRLALVGHLEFYQALVRNVVQPLRCNGIVFELGYEDQAEETARCLGPDWLCGRYEDSAGNLRCVVGWRKSSEMSILSLLVNGGLIEVL